MRNARIGRRLRWSAHALLLIGMHGHLLLWTIIASTSTPTVHGAPSFLIDNCYDDPLPSSNVLSIELTEVSEQMRDNVDLREPFLCIDACLKRAFRYAGVRNQSQCWCGIEVKGGSQSTRCVNCEGDARYRCGGDDVMAVYYTPHVLSRVRFLDCLSYKTDEERSVLPSALRELSFISYRVHSFRQPQSCMTACVHRGYRYAGISYRFWCHCTNDLDQSGNSSQCEPCQGNGNYQCGLKNSISVYEVEQEAPIVQICGGEYRTVLAGTQASLHCVVDDASSITDFWWEFKYLRYPDVQRPLPAGSQVIPISGGIQLLLPGVTKEHAGVYVCVGENGANLVPSQQNGHASVELLVQESARASIHQLHPGSVNQSIVFQCDFEGEEPLSIIWYWNNTPLHPSFHHVAENNTLTAVQLLDVHIETFEKHQILTMLQFGVTLTGVISCQVIAPAVRFSYVQEQTSSVQISYNEEMDDASRNRTSRPSINSPAKKSTASMNNRTAGSTMPTKIDQSTHPYSASDSTSPSAPTLLCNTASSSHPVRNPPLLSWDALFFLTVVMCVVNVILLILLMLIVRKWMRSRRENNAVHSISYNKNHTTRQNPFYGSPTPLSTCE